MRDADEACLWGVKCRAIGEVSYCRGPLMDPADLQRYKRLLLEKQREVSSPSQTLKPGCQQRLVEDGSEGRTLQAE